MSTPHYQPAEFHSITPSLTIKGAAAAIDFYIKAFGAVERFRLAGDDGIVMHAEMQFGDSIVMLSDEFPSYGALSPTSIGGMGGSLMFYVPDVDSAHDRAVAAGCTMHLAKPVRLATLFSTVEAAMRQGAQPVVEPERPEPSLAPVLLDIDPLLADLVPGYIREKRRQMADLRRLVTEGDMDRLKRIAHDIKGTGAAYGVPDVTRLGRALETAGQQGDASLASSLVEELDTLLARVQVQLGVA